MRKFIKIGSNYHSIDGILAVYVEEGKNASGEITRLRVVHKGGAFYVSKPDEVKAILSIIEG